MTGFGFVLLLMFFSLCECRTAKLPDQFQRCHRSDPGMDTCLTKAIESALHWLATKEVPYLGVAALDPIDITEIHIGEGASAVNLVQNYYNVKLHGLKDSKIEDAHMDFEKLVLTFTVKADIIQKAKYNITGKVMLLPVYGEGESTLKFDNASLKMKIAFKEETKKGLKFYTVDKCVMDITVSGAHYDFQNLFNGQTDLANNILKVINDNSLDIFADVKPGVDKSYGLVFEALSRKFFDKIPADEIFLQ